MEALFTVLGVVLPAVYLMGAGGRRVQEFLEYRFSWYSPKAMTYASAIVETLFGLGFIRGPALAAAWQGNRGMRTLFILIGVFFFLEGLLRFVINKYSQASSLGSIPVIILTYPFSYYLKKKNLEE